ncbi:MAG: HAD-IA family hydrolase [Planctomycetia bacterium]|nr:HAD-IA family hydrolase [Planctomycetia bacterium]
MLFDAVGTLLSPAPPVAVAYQRAAERFGIQVALDEVDRRFSRAFRRQEELDAALGHGRTSDERERQRWRQIVADVFPDAPHPKGLFEALWRHFADGGNWALADDAAAAIEGLRALGKAVGIASNFDSRLLEICRAQPPLASCRLFISSQVGARKPHAAFFAAIQRKLSLPPEKLLLVGDNFENDYEGARRAGWQAILLVRGGRTPREGCRVTHTLGELLSL